MSHDTRTINNLIVTIDRDLCIGAATCLAFAPEVFTLDNESKAIFLEKIEQADESQILDSARGCPTAAISVTDLSGKKLAP